MGPKHLVMGVELGLSLYLSYLAFQRSGFVAAVIVCLTVATLFATFTQGLGMGIWQGLSNLTNPFISALTGFLVGFSYAVFEMPSSNPWLVGFGALFLAGVSSIVLFNFWNIGG